MRAQLTRLLADAQHPNLAVQVLPFSNGAHCAVVGDFVMPAFSDSQTSSRCSKGGCGVAPLPDGGALVRDTKDRTRDPLTFDGQKWADFFSAVKNGEFDF